jgi:hypothetical protein
MSTTPFPPAGPGDWLYVDRLWIFIPEAATSKQIVAAAETLLNVAEHRRPEPEPAA